MRPVFPVLAAFVLLASSPLAALADQASGPQAAPAAPFDITKVDPHSFKAMAYRLPDGLAPTIDGKLDDEAWALAPVQGGFTQREPAFGQPASEKTEFRILYDDKKIYLGVWAWDDDPSGIIANEMKRDSGLRRSDQLKVVFDTFHDHRNAFYFSTSPYGALKDAQNVENGRTINYDWNAVWENETSIDDKGWYVEIAIPLSQLRFAESAGESVWGLNLCRIVMRKNEEDYWVPFPREWGAGGFARASNAGLLLGLTDVKARRRMEFLP
ncbi:MAG: carbohydrate binding family 9 domain-containing protein, partial [Vicinamibacterales bacterium]